MKEERPFLQIPLPSPNDWQAYEEWVRREKEKARDDDDKENVIVIEV
tara:strand:- start:167 stop:307 length:141 start_codon:yes stop_codon:yes gene_type:complete